MQPYFTMMSGTLFLPKGNAWVYTYVVNNLACAMSIAATQFLIVFNTSFYFSFVTVEVNDIHKRA